MSGGCALVAGGCILPAGTTLAVVVAAAGVLSCALESLSSSSFVLCSFAGRIGVSPVGSWPRVVARLLGDAAVGAGTSFLLMYSSYLSWSKF